MSQYPQSDSQEFSGGGGRVQQEFAIQTLRFHLLGIDFYCNAPYQSRFLGRGCDEALSAKQKGFSVKRGEAIQ